MTRKLVFVSYARADEPERPVEGEVQWLTFLLGYLKAAFVGMEVEIFTDRGLAGGADWNAEIERRLRTCDAFVLLVSPHSMTSAFVVEKEIAIVRKREKAGDAPLFVPIMLSPTPEGALALVSDKNWRPRGDKTLWEYPPNERARKMMEVSDEIASQMRAKYKFVPAVSSKKTLISRLAMHSGKIAVILSVRAALRILPMYRSSLINDRDAIIFGGISDFYCTILLANALAIVLAKFPEQSYSLAGTVQFIRRALSQASAYSYANDAAEAVEHAILAALSSEPREAAGAAAAYSAAHAPSPAAAAAAWAAVTADLFAGVGISGHALTDLPLWPDGAPDWAGHAWRRLRKSFTPDGGSDVWIDWYEGRLQGVPRSKDYEITFANVPEEVFEEGAKAVNAWIREHLPPTPPPPDLPPPVDNGESPADFAWDDASLIEQIAGFAQAPLFAHESSPADQAQELAAARAACDWLLKVLGARLHNVGSFYAMRVEAIRDALPASAERGAILIAYNHALTLREKLIADDGVPDEVRSDAIRVVESVFALCRFYPEIERHMVGVARMKDVDLLPTAALRGFARAVRGAPGVFGASVVGGLGTVEALGPEGPSPAPQSDRAIPAPPQTPPADKSAARLKAGWVNALYKTFREGPQIVGATDAWIDAAHKVGEAAKPILEWLARSVGG